MLILDTNNDFDFAELQKKLENIYKEILLEINGNNLECSITFVDNEFIKKINKEYRNIDKTTDVLSFEMYDDNSVNNILGEVYIATEIAKKKSIEINNSLEEEIYFLATHGLLHLIGYNHQNKDDEFKMIMRQKEILKKVGIRNE